MSKQRVVIFGGSGFIGTRLARRLLDAGKEVRIADVDPGTPLPDLFVEADVRELDDCVRACRGMDVIYNLAAEHDDDVFPVQRYYDTNVGGARHVCRAAEELEIRRIVFTSTVAVYGLPDHEVDETGEPAPFNDYGKSKLQAEGVYRQWARAEKDRCLVTVRPTVIFGEGNRRNFYVLLSQIASGRFVMVGAGRNRKSIGYVENCAAFLEYVLRFESGEHTFNYVDKPDFDMNTLVPLLRSMLGKDPQIRARLPYWAGYTFGMLCDVVARLTRRKLPISAIRVKKFCGSTQFSARKALETGFVPPIEMKEGLRRTILAEFRRGSDGTPTTDGSAPGQAGHVDDRQAESADSV